MHLQAPQQINAVPSRLIYRCYDYPASSAAAKHFALALEVDPDDVKKYLFGNA
jgi:hypothetical protein